MSRVVVTDCQGNRREIMVDADWDDSRDKHLGNKSFAFYLGFILLLMAAIPLAAFFIGL